MKSDDVVVYDAGELYNTRLIVLLEIKSLSNKYSQVLLTPMQFKAVSETICEQFGGIPGTTNPVIIELDGEVFPLPERIKSYKR